MVENSTCTNGIVKNERDYAADKYLKYDAATGYVFTTQPLNAYYKPKDVFVCCYLSETYG
jgi:hypothetical protein